MSPVNSLNPGGLCTNTARAAADLHCLKHFRGTLVFMNPKKTNVHAGAKQRGW